MRGVDHKIDPQRLLQHLFFPRYQPTGKGGTNLVDVPAAENQEIFDKKVRDKANLENSLRKTIADLDQRFQEKLKEKDPALGLKAIPAPGSQQRGDDLYLLPDSRNNGEIWEYTFENPGDNWFEIGFDDSKWKKGWVDLERRARQMQRFALRGMVGYLAS